MTRDELLGILESDVVAGAKALLGATLVRGSMSARVVETEAYRGEDDPACHAFGKRKMKNMALFGTPGHSYIYFTYGSHWMLNVVAHPVGIASGILIRAAQPLTGVDDMRANRGVDDVRNLLSGPGKLAKAFDIDMRDNDLELVQSVPLSEGLSLIPPLENVANILEGPRIGISVGRWEDVAWRFVDADRAEWASRPLPPATKPGKIRTRPAV